MPSVKKRNWAFILYPESAPDDWEKRLQLYGVPCAVSPVHDKDLTDKGELKKPHYHVILSYKSPTTYNNVSEFVKSLNQPIPIPVQDVSSYFEYLWHESEEDKAPYNKDDVKLYCGFKPPREKLDNEQKVLGLFSFIRDNQITDYALLIDILGDTNQIDLLEYAVSHAYAVVSYLRSSIPPHCG